MERKTYCFSSHKDTKEVLWVEADADCIVNPVIHKAKERDVGVMVTAHPIGDTLECTAVRASDGKLYTCSMDLSCTWEHLVSVLKVWLNLEGYEFKQDETD